MTQLKFFINAEYASAKKTQLDISYMILQSCAPQF